MRDEEKQQAIMSSMFSPYMVGHADLDVGAVEAALYAPHNSLTGHQQLRKQ
jgi:hypothetical protein